MNTKVVWALGAVVLLVVFFVSGNAAYTAIKERPPQWLISLVTKTTPPPPLPEGSVLPFAIPSGFVGTIFSRITPGARVLALDPLGTLVVSETKTGTIVALPDDNKDGVADSAVTLIQGLNNPHGLVFRCTEASQACVLYVAESDKVSAYTYDKSKRTAVFQKTLLALPGEGLHITRSLVLAPDGRLLVAVGSTCNVCDEVHAARAAVTAINLNTGTSSLYATGLRNTVGLAVDPVTGFVWGADNGRDLLGDDIPPDEVNIISEGNKYGWPICYGQNIHDTDFDHKQYFRDPCADATPAHIDLQAHSAPLGLAFIPEEGWPSGMGNDLLVTYHGSWNRSTPTGYKVVQFHLDANRNAVGGPIDFMTGFLGAGQKPNDAFGRPVSVLALPGGALYVSDDRAGAVYRVTVRN